MSEADDLSASRGHPRLWLAAGLVAGLAMALWGVLGPRGGEPPLPESAAARVNGTLIQRVDYARALQAVANDTRDPLDAAERRRILKRLIDEELLVQNGFDLGLAHDLPRIRDLLVDAVFQGLREQAAAETIDEADARAYYRAHAAQFTGPDLLRVRVIRTNERAAAAAATKRLRSGEAWPAVAGDLAAGPTIVPDTLLPPDKLADYLGPDMTRKAQALTPGAAAGPLARDGHYYALALLDRRPTAPPPFRRVKQAVEDAMRRQMAEDALQKRLAALRHNGDVEIADDLLDAPD